MHAPVASPIHSSRLARRVFFFSLLSFLRTTDVFVTQRTNSPFPYLSRCKTRCSCKGRAGFRRIRSPDDRLAYDDLDTRLVQLRILYNCFPQSRDNSDNRGEIMPLGSFFFRTNYSEFAFAFDNIGASVIFDPSKGSRMISVCVDVYVCDSTII